MQMHFDNVTNCIENDLNRFEYGIGFIYINCVTCVGRVCVCEALRAQISRIYYAVCIFDDDKLRYK